MRLRQFCTLAQVYSANLPASAKAGAVPFLPQAEKKNKCLVLAWLPEPVPERKGTHFCQPSQAVPAC